ncbi:ribonuclease R [Desulfocurvibacter africanus]|uniref:ribonuclease R n=1 Tax=Desulfocurvibacter africanus TaxID=873 RepID=UPI00041D8327|nr:ribonuclease R [Desulfocurvibacter africanus]
MSRPKRKSHQSAVDRETVLELFREARKPLSDKEILRNLGAQKQEKEALRHVLLDLAEEGRVVQIGRGWGLADRMNMVSGRLEVQRSGVGFVISEDKRRRDIFVNPKDFNGAWHGDRVMVVVTRDPGGTRRPEGRIARIIERSTQELAVRVQRRLHGTLWLCEPANPKLTISMVVDIDGEQPRPGDLLVARVGEQIDRNLWDGELLHRLGREDDVVVQEALVKLNNGVPTEFPAQVLAQAEEMPTVPDPKEWGERRDMREVGFVTIDGAKARDFDDAVYVERRGRGYTLWVAIADVAHYVRPGTSLDREAQERGNSYYFPQSVEPMFPEKLSNGLCSLNPDVPRLTMVAEIDFDAKGEPGRTDFYAAVIQSHARLTYDQVNSAVLEKDEEERARIPHVLPMLDLSEELARKLNKQRKLRGSLDFDLPEPEILFNLQGETMDIRPRVRNFAHQIIEEFMVSANEAVARFLSDRDRDFLYRIHPEPNVDKIAALFELLMGTEIGHKVPEEASPKGLQSLLAAAQGKALEFMVNRLTLRTMMQAKYSPDNVGHFGLASECYAHFTSPIRRYADLVLHRALKDELSLAGGARMSHDHLTEVGDHISARERVAMDAEREILKRVTILFLKDKVGQEFTGVINGMADFGFWVELREVMAEGMVRLSTISDDYYAFFSERHMLVGERTGRIFRLGQAVKIRLMDVSLERLEVNMELAEGEQGAEAAESGVELPGTRKQRKKAVGQAVKTVRKEGRKTTMTTARKGEKPARPKSRQGEPAKAEGGAEAPKAKRGARKPVRRPRFGRKKKEE